MVTLKRVYTREWPSQTAAASAPILWWAPADQHLHKRPPQHQQVVLVQSPVRSLLLSSESWCVQGCVCACQDWRFSFPQSCRSLVIKSLWPLNSDSLGIPSPFVRSPGWEAWHVVQNLQNSGRTSLILLVSSLWVTHLASMGFDFYHDCAPPSVLLWL